MVAEALLFVRAWTRQLNDIFELLLAYLLLLLRARRLLWWLLNMVWKPKFFAQISVWCALKMHRWSRGRVWDTLFHILSVHFKRSDTLSVQKLTLSFHQVLQIWLRGNQGLVNLHIWSCRININSICRLLIFRCRCNNLLLLLLLDLTVILLMDYIHVLVLVIILC